MLTTLNNFGRVKMTEELTKDHICLVLHQLLKRSDLMFDICEIYNVTPYELKEAIEQTLKDFT